MKPLMGVIVVAALVAGSAVWAGTQHTYNSWGQHYWPGMNQSQMMGQTPMAGYAAPASPADAATPYGGHRWSRWYNWMSPRHHRANWYGVRSAGGHGCYWSHGCR